MATKKKRRGILLKALTFDQTIVALAKANKAKLVKPRRLEDCEPGASRSDVLGNLRKTAKTAPR